MNGDGSTTSSALLVWVTHLGAGAGAAVKTCPANVVSNAPLADAVPVATVIARPPTDETTTTGVTCDTAYQGSSACEISRSVRETAERTARTGLEDGETRGRGSERRRHLFEHECS